MATRQLVRENAELEAELRRRLRGEVRFDRMTRAIYATDASIYQMDPVGVVFPMDVEDVVNTVTFSAVHGVPVLPRGGGTGLAGQTVNHAIVMDFSRHMNQLIEMNAEEGWAWVQPGIVLDQLSALGAPHGLKFAPDPSTTNRGNIGGAIGNNSCGARSIVYGKTLDHVLELEVVLADGTVTTFRELTPEELEAKLALQTLEGRIYREARRIAAEQAEEIDRRYPKIQRRVSGYNLDEVLRDPMNMAKVVVGSEGTLVTFTRAKVRMAPRPKAAALAVVHFHTILESFEATVALLDSGASAIEQMDNTIVRQGRAHPGLSPRMSFVEGDPASMLLVEASGDTPEEAAAGLERIAQTIERRGLGYHTLKVTDPRQQSTIWAVRRDGLGLIMSVEGTAKPLPFVEDTAVPPERLPEYFQRFDEMVRDEKTTAAYYGHASVGCMHIRPLVDIKQQEGLDRMVRIAERVSDLVLEFGGSLSGEHGDGIVRGVFTEKMFGPRLYEAFREFKRVFDPQGIMNPNKIVDCPPLAENLRFDPQWKPMQIETYFDFSRDGGIAEHAEMCNGQGACRQTFGGQMCPSYMATRDEEHSTRGRANALRTVFSGLVPHTEFTGERLHEVLGLCLECKGCKFECPSSVDMAKLKYEFLGHYHAEHGFTLRERLFGNVHRLNPIGETGWRRTERRVAAARRGAGTAAARHPPEAAAAEVRGPDVHELVPEAQAGFDGLSPNGGRLILRFPSGRTGGAARARRAVQRHLHGGQLPRRRYRRHQAAGAVGVQRRDGAAMVLRARHDVQGHAAEGHRACSPQHRCPLSAGRRGHPHRRDGAVLPVDAARRVPRPAAGRPAGAGGRAAIGAARRAARPHREGGGRPAAGVPAARGDGALPRPLPPARARRRRRVAGRTAERAGRAGGGAGRGLLRHGRRLRLRGGALRRVHGRRRAGAVPGGAREPRRNRRHHRRVLPPAGRARHGRHAPAPRRVSRQPARRGVADA